MQVIRAFFVSPGRLHGCTSAAGGMEEAGPGYARSNSRERPGGDPAVINAVGAELVPRKSSRSELRSCDNQVDGKNSCPDFVPR